ncbi:ATP-dependent helicase [Psychrobacter sp. FDAARGOS_221]|nr:ATP-dependent helicase [Psychrobacter sp. FDAARGOS_221]
MAALEANLITPQSLSDQSSSNQPLSNKPLSKKSDTAQSSTPDSSESINKLTSATDPEVDYLTELNPSQYLAATTIEGKVLVIAGAGSGKTKTLTYRTSYLIEKGAAPRSILLLTFTRKAANEIKARVKTLLGDRLEDGQNINDITSGTFHSFCNMLLRRYSGLLGINPRFSILDTGDSEDAIDLIRKEKGYTTSSSKTKPTSAQSKQAFPRKQRLQKIISTARNRHILIHDLIESEYPDLMIHADAIEQLAKDYHKYKRTHHLYDFDDIISQVVKHLKINLQFRKLLQDTYRYVMVDEYQDTNIPQKQLIDYICQPEQVSLMVVGDDNQSIYAFRGASYENILLFSDSYPQAKLIKLEQNYRSTPAILSYVNALSDQITLGYQKRLFSELPVNGQRPVFCRRSDEAAEAKYIADTLLELKSEYDYGYNDFAVLGRTSFQSSHIQLEFMKRGIPFIVVGGIKFLEKRHIKDVLALVKILHNPNDTIAWHRILTLFKGIGEVTATKLTQAFIQQGNSLQPLLDPKLNKKNEHLIELYHVLTKAEQTDAVAEMIDALIDFYIPVLQALEDNWRERAEDFRVLKSLAQEHSSIDRFLESLALDPPNDSVAAFDPSAPEDKDAVTISTIHSAKGLEWPVVFINALIDGMMPHHRSLDDFESIEEERKLFYVACSRAKTHLYLTAPNYFSSFAGFFDKISRFISEVPADCVNFEATTQAQMQPNGNNRHLGNKHNRLEDIGSNQDPDWW